MIGLDTNVLVRVLVVDARAAVAAALAGFRATKADFSDCLIVARNAAAGCAGTASLDKDMRPLPGVIAF